VTTTQPRYQQREDHVLLTYDGAARNSSRGPAGRR